MYTRNYQIKRDDRTRDPQNSQPTLFSAPSPPDIPVPCAPPSPQQSAEPLSKLSDICQDALPDLPEFEQCTDKKHRFRAVKLPRFPQENIPDCAPECNTCEQNEMCRESCENTNELCPDKPDHRTRKPENCEKNDKGLLSALSKHFSHDEMFVLALAVLLLCQGGDEILILALCFILM